MGGTDRFRIRIVTCLNYFTGRFVDYLSMIMIPRSLGTLVMGVIVLTSVPSVHSAIVFAERFDYAAGDLQANSGGVWGLDGVPAAGTNYQVKPTGWGTGNGVQTDPREGNIRSRHTVDLTAFTNSTVYFSVMVDALPVPAEIPYNGNGAEGLRFVAMGLWSANTERLYFGKASGTNSNWGFYNYTGGSAFSTTSSVGSVGPTQLVVRVDFSASGTDSVKMYVLDAGNLPLTEPLTASVERTGGELGTIDNIRFATGWSAAGAAQPTSWAMYDNIGVYTGWNDLAVINVPEPGSLLLLSAGFAGLLGRRRRAGSAP